MGGRDMGWGGGGEWRDGCGNKGRRRNEMNEYYGLKYQFKTVGSNILTTWLPKRVSGIQRYLRKSKIKTYIIEWKQ